jgi:hypothetical protein
VSSSPDQEYVLHGCSCITAFAGKTNRVVSDAKNGINNMYEKIFFNFYSPRQSIKTNKSIISLGE